MPGVSTSGKNEFDCLGFSPIYCPGFQPREYLVERFGLIEDIKFCLTNDVANVLPLYSDGKLVRG
ncbi:MAG: hypothetical protein NTW29_01395 [Bacteroidetes bacterium]|nr:hypothetical protein [Bacteroidota bacterium]